MSCMFRYMVKSIFSDTILHKSWALFISSYFYQLYWHHPSLSELSIVFTWNHYGILWVYLCIAFPEEPSFWILQVFCSWASKLCPLSPSSFINHWKRNTLTLLLYLANFLVTSAYHADCSQSSVTEYQNPVCKNAWKRSRNLEKQLQGEHKKGASEKQQPKAGSHQISSPHSRTPRNALLRKLAFAFFEVLIIELYNISAIVLNLVEASSASICLVCKEAIIFENFKCFVKDLLAFLSTTFSTSLLR